MSYIKPTDLGSKFLSKVSTPADLSAISAVQLYERQVGSDGATSNTVYSLSKYYIPGTNTLMVFLNGQKLEVDEEYTETNGLTVTFASALQDSDVLEFYVVGHYRVDDSELESALGQLPSDDNLLINGGFDVWQRGTSHSTTGFGSDDRWKTTINGTTMTNSRQTFTPGQTDVPGNPMYYCRTVVSAGAGASDYCQKYQCIEDCATLSGKTATLSFYAKASAALDVTFELFRNYGSGGSTIDVVLAGEKFNLTTSWAKYTYTFAIPSISGKTIGTGSYLGISLWFDSGSTFDSRNDTLGHQSGTFELANMKLEEGAVATPYVSRPIAQELALCQRYYVRMYAMARERAAVGSQSIESPVFWPVTMRATPTATILSAGTQNNVSSSQVVSPTTTGVRFSILATSATTDTYDLNSLIEGDAEL